jgi:arylsulfatase A-like enzyme
VLLLVLVLVTHASTSDGASHDKPNIVLILADDLGYADLGVQGAPDVVTPHIDSLAANGIRCTDAYVTSPVCSPSRAGILTGRYQNRFGFEFLVNDTSIVSPGRKVGLAADETTIADRMKALGYVTGCIGKWHVGDEHEFLPMNRGFDEFYGTLGQSGYFSPMLIDSRRGPKPQKINAPGLLRHR